MPTCAIEQQDGVRALGDMAGYLVQVKLDTSNNSPIWFVSDSIVLGESEMIPCEISRGFSMSMIA
jgi:hypothetical protein